MNPDIQIGDVFVVEGNMGFLSSMIRGVDWFWSPDNEASYGHAGIITNSSGDTLEALWSVRKDNISRYKDKPVLIARPTFRVSDGRGITDAERFAAVKRVEKEFLGKTYPVWRLPLMVIPPLGKFVASGNWLVCSELVAYYEYLIGARCKPYTGVYPGTLADEWRRWKNFDVIQGN